MKLEKVYLRAVAGAACLMFAMSFGFSSITYFVPAITKEFSFDRAHFSLLFTFISLAGMFTMPMIGRILQKIGVRAFIFFSSFWIAACLLAFAACSALWQFYLVGVAMGLIGMACTTMAASVVVNNWFVEKRGTVLGVVMAASGISSAINAAILPQFMDAFGWRASIFLMAGIWIFVTLLGAFLIGQEPSRRGIHPYGFKIQSGTAVLQTEGVPYHIALHSSAFYGYMIGIFLLYFPFGFLQHLPAFLQDVGCSSALLGALMMGYSLTLCLAKVIQGNLYDRIGLVKGTFCVLLCGGIGFILLQTGVSALLWPAVILLAVGVGSLTVLPSLLLTKLFGMRDFSSIWGIAMAASTLSGAVANPAWGVVYDRTGSYGSALCFSPVLLVVCFVCFAFSLQSQKRCKTA